MELDKKALLSQLNEAAKLLEVVGDPYRARAFANAARSLDDTRDDLAALIDAGEIDRLKGVGKTLAAELVAYRQAGQLPVLTELHAQVPVGVRGLLAVRGLGAKKVATLWHHDIDSVEALVAAIENGDLAAIKGFGGKSAATIGDAARFALEAKKRMRRDTAEHLAERLTAELQTALPELRLEPIGSLRRGLETVGDIDLLAANVSFAALEAALLTLGTQEDVTPPRIRVRYDDHDAEVFLTEPDVWGAALAVGTGDAAFRERLMARAAERGYTLSMAGSRAGLFRGDERIATPTEAALFAHLELPHLPPELRDAEAPQPSAPPTDLVTVDAIRGVVHNHSHWSDGQHSLRDMVAAARERGYRYLAMADHSKSSYYAGGLSVERLEHQAAEIAEIRAELRAEASDFTLLHGVEVDIMSDGSLDYDDEVLATLDYTVVSVHQNFTLSRAKQTERIVRAVRNPYATILGHATGRVLLRRPGYDVDVEAVIEACAETGTVVEINANPRRLDLDWRWVIRARELGCSFAINPDAHSREGFDVIRHGVTVARKAGLRAADVVNCEPDAAAFLARLKPRPGASAE
ncbi:MAG: PHP domain-containing protein [Trueperaceae bacterium]|nr:PHP domain-containing protein [Trueperaceae bacterium]